MMTIYFCLGIALLCGLVCFIVEKSESIRIHIDRHHDALLAGLTGGTTGFFISLIINLNISWCVFIICICSPSVILFLVRLNKRYCI